MQRSTRTRRDKHSQVRSETTCPSTLKQGSPEHDLRNSAEASNRFTSTPFHSESLCNRAGSGPDWVMVASMALWPRFRAYSRCELLLVRTDTHVSWVSNSGLRIRHLRVVASNVVGHAVVSEGSMTILVSHLSSRHYSRNVKWPRSGTILCCVDLAMRSIANLDRSIRCPLMTSLNIRAVRVSHRRRQGIMSPKLPSTLLPASWFR